MLDRIAQLARSAATLVACLTIGAGCALNGVPVERTSLLGYEVAGQVWEAPDAARALAHEASKRAPAEPSLHPDLLKGPVFSFGYWSEVWFAGDAASRRIADLRAALLSENVKQAMMPRQGFTVEDAKISIRYWVPAGVAVPPIEIT